MYCSLNFAIFVFFAACRKKCLPFIQRKTTPPAKMLHQEQSWWNIGLQWK